MYAPLRMLQDCRELLNGHGSCDGWGSLVKWLRGGIDEGGSVLGDGLKGRN